MMQPLTEQLADEASRGHGATIHFALEAFDNCCI